MLPAGKPIDPIWNGQIILGESSQEVTLATL